MARQSKPFEHPLDPELAQGILNIPLGSGVKPEPRTIGERIFHAMEAVAEANRHLDASPVAKIVAESIMRDLKRRGDARIVVRPDGTVVLRVVYGNGEPERPVLRPRRDAPAVQAAHGSTLPYLDDLRKEAVELGLDISHLGQRRRAIHEFIEARKSQGKASFDEVRRIPVEDVTALPGRGRTTPPEEEGLDIDAWLGR